MISVILAGAGAAHAFEITQPIPGTNDTACVDVRNAEAGENVIAFPCGDAFNEQWSMVDGLIQGIGTSSSGAKCLLPAVSFAPNATLDTCPASGGNSAFAPNGKILFHVGDFDVCLTSNGYGPDGVLSVVLCSSVFVEKTEIWVLKDVVIAQKEPGTDRHACVDVRDSAIVDHTKVISFPCTLGANERWTYVLGQLKGIGTTKEHSTCLAETARGEVELQTCSSSPLQIWAMQGGETSGHVTGVAVQNNASGHCLDSHNKYGDVQVAATKCDLLHLTTSQLWVLR